MDIRIDVDKRTITLLKPIKFQELRKLVKGVKDFMDFEIIGTQKESYKVENGSCTGTELEQRLMSGTIDYFFRENQD